jgi:hypothetical protein
LTGWHQDIIAAVADFCRARKATCWQSQTVPQAAVLHLADHYYAHNEPLFNYGSAVQPVEGALHALLETHHATDVLSEDAALQRINAYKLVVVPEQTRLSARMVTKLEAFAAHGGHVLISGAHLAHEVATLVGVVPRGDPVTDPVYLPLDDRAVPVSGPWQPVIPQEGVEVWHYRLVQQEPQKDISDAAVVTRRNVGQGAIVAVHGPIFRDYYLGHYPLLRHFIAGLTARLGIVWTVTVEASPRMEMILRQKNNKLLVNLVNRGAGEMLSSQRVIVEELLPVEHAVVRIRRAVPPKSVTVEPDHTPIEWSYHDGLLEVNVPAVDIHCVVVVE